MASFWANPNGTQIAIPRTEELEGVTVYVINININNITWEIKHSYKDFFVLHQYLTVEHRAFPDMLPQKNLIKYRSTIHTEHQRNGLAAYLRSLLNYFQYRVPRVLAHFLCFHKYDTYFIVVEMSYKLFISDNAELSSTKDCSFNALQLHAISSLYQEPSLSIEESDKRYDVCHIMDLCSQLHHLQIDSTEAPYKTSNIVPDMLGFELSIFKRLQTLEMIKISPHRIYAVGTLRETLKVCKIHYTGITRISDMLLCDAVNQAITKEEQIWQNVTELDLSYNAITNIDSSTEVVPQLCTLNLTQNQITTIENLAPLASLSAIILSQNNLASLKGLERLYSLKLIDLSYNCIFDVQETIYVAELPCLEDIYLTGNPVTVIIDYRVKVFEFFGSRVSDISLDNEKPTDKEVDTAIVLQALRILKEGNAPTISKQLQ